MKVLVFTLCQVILAATFTCQAQDHKPVRWYFDAKSIGKEEAMLTFTAVLEDGWHIYSQFMEEGGPLPTTFTFAPKSEYKRVGKVKEESKAITSYNDIFMMDIIWYSNIAVFTQKVKLHAPSSTVKGKIEYMVCTDEMCLPPDVIDFSLDIKGESVAGATKSSYGR